MFDFLFEEAPKRTGLDMETLVEFGKEASNALIGVNQSPLNETITKIAKIHNLNKDQIELVCQEANKATHKGMFKSASEKYVTFDVADFNTVGDMIEGVTEKVASSVSIDMDYVSAPGEAEAYRDYELNKDVGHNGLWDMEKQASRQQIENAKVQEEDLKDIYIIKTAGLESKEEEFLKLASAQVVNETFSYRPQMVMAIAGFCKQANMKYKRASNLLVKLSSRMVDGGWISKEAMEESTDKYVSDKVESLKVNTSHPLVKVINTIKDFDRERDEAVRGLQNIVKSTGANE